MIFDICFGIGWLAVCGFVIYTLWKHDQPVYIDPERIDAPRVIEYSMNGHWNVEYVLDFEVYDEGYIWFETIDGVEVALACDEWRYVVRDGDEP